MNEVEMIMGLRKELAAANESYYKKHVSLMSDEEFDIKMQQLVTLERKHPELSDASSPSNVVGSDLRDERGLIRHKVPMLSLANTYSQQELDKVCATFGDGNLSVEWKVDGCSLSLIYEDGLIRTLSTRGDGECGTDVTSKLMSISGIPWFIPCKGKLEIRGEVYMSYAQFGRYNHSHDKPLANPRNGCAGLLAKDGMVGEYLSFAAYEVLGMNFKDRKDKYLFLASKGFEIPLVSFCKSNELHDYVTRCDAERGSLLYPVDGLVIKVCDTQFAEELGATSKYPNWAIAYKFKADNIGTPLRNVVWQVGSTGQLTPVAEFDTIQLAGTNVSRATLNNHDWYSKMLSLSCELHEGDILYVEKGGEIIPKVTRIEQTHESVNEGKAFEVPTVCPECGGKISKIGANHYCTNPNCHVVRKGVILHWCSKDCMDIKGVGPAVVDELWEQGIQDVAALYLRTDFLIGNSEAVTAKLLTAIEESKQQPLWRLLHALHIPGVGKSASKLLAKRFGNIESIMRLSIDDLMGIDGIGNVVAVCIYSFFHAIENLAMLCMLPLDALNKQNASTEQADTPVVVRSLEGEHILVSGNFGTPARRKEIESLVEQAGAKLISNVTLRMDYLVIPNHGIDTWKQSAGSKYRKCQEYCKTNRIITEDEFLSMISV